MGSVFFSVSVSLDGYLAPPGMDLTHAADPSYQDRGAHWGKLHNWRLRTLFIRERLKLDAAAPEGLLHQLVVYAHLAARTAASWASACSSSANGSGPKKRVSHARLPGARAVGAPWRHDLLLRQRRARERALPGASGCAIAISASPEGADLLQQFPRGGQVDEFTLAISPVFIAEGTRLFARVGSHIRLQLLENIASPHAIHARYTSRALHVTRATRRVRRPPCRKAS